MKIHYKKPNFKSKDYLLQMTDKNGKTFWLNWKDWLYKTEIDKKEKINLLPKEILKLYTKWQNDLQQAKEVDICPEYPIKSVSISFIYNNQFYKITPGMFDEKYETRYYFYGAREIILKDLLNIGCIYAKYFDELD